MSASMSRSLCTNRAATVFFFTEDIAPALAGFALGNGVGQPYFYGLAAACTAIAGLALLLRRVTPRPADLGIAPEPAGTPADNVPVPAGSAPTRPPAT
jgi:hypothetical protein